MSRQYNDPWARVADSANNAMFRYMSSRPTEAQNAMAEKYSLEAQQLRGQLNAPSEMGRMVGEIYSNTMDAPSPDFVGPMGKFDGPVPVDVINRRYQERKPQMVENAMRYSGNKPGSLGDVFLSYAANTGATPEDVSSAQIGSGMSYGATREGVMNKPFTLSPGSQRYDSQGKVIASSPFKQGGQPSLRVLPDGTVEYGYDGEPTKTVTNNLQGSQVQSEKMSRLIKYNRELAMKDEMNFGLPGRVKGVVQDVTTLSDGVAKSLGYNGLDGARKGIQRELAVSGVDQNLLSDVFDPNLPALNSAAGLLVFQAAKTLADQEGRALSNEDIKYFKDIVGDPKDVFTSQQKYMSKLDTIEKILGMNTDVANQTLGGNVVTKRPYSPNKKNVVPQQNNAPTQQQIDFSEEEEARLQELQNLKDQGEI